MAEVGDRSVRAALRGDPIDSAIAAVPVGLRIRMRRAPVEPIGDIDRAVGGHSKISRSKPFVIGLEQIAAMRGGEARAPSIHFMPLHTVPQQIAADITSLKARRQ